MCHVIWYPAIRFLDISYCTTLLIISYLRGFCEASSKGRGAFAGPNCTRDRCAVPSQKVPTYHFRYKRPSGQPADLPTYHWFRQSQIRARNGPYGAVTAYSLQSDVKFPWECPICKTPGSPSFKYIVADGTHSASTSQHHWVDPDNWRKSPGESLCDFTCAMEKCL